MLTVDYARELASKAKDREEHAAAAVTRLESLVGDHRPQPAVERTLQALRDSQALLRTCHEGADDLVARLQHQPVIRG